jgi:hypothetical protein
MPTAHTAAESFTHDVFLSQSAKDKAVMRAVAERLREGGLRVWLDEWEIKPGESYPHPAMRLAAGWDRLFSGAKARCGFQ